jgi:DNA replication protein DnaC
MAATTGPPLKAREVGDGWAVDTTCRGCGDTMTLTSEERPGALALRFAKLAVCEKCAEASDKRERERSRVKDWEARVFRSKLPAALQGFTFDDMDALEAPRKAAIDAVRHWAKNRDTKGVCLFGSPGSGKTRLAATGAWARLRNHPVRWVSVPNLLTMAGAYGDDGRREAVKTIAGTGCLVLDDLDKINPSEWAKAQLFTAIDARVQAGKPILVTTNLSPGKLGERFGQPIVSRIVGACDVFEMPGRDRRLFPAGTRPDGP